MTQNLDVGMDERTEAGAGQENGFKIVNNGTTLEGAIPWDKLGP